MKYKKILIIFLISQLAHAGRLQDLMQWIKEKNTEYKCNNLLAIYTEECKNQTLTPVQEKSFETLIMACSNRKLAHIHKSNSTPELDAEINKAYPVVLKYIGKK